MLDCQFKANLYSHHHCGSWSGHSGHCELREQRIQIPDVKRCDPARNAIPGLVVVAHLEPVEDPVSLNDMGLERGMGRWSGGNGGVT